jgi:hypothetical protein
MASSVVSALDAMAKNQKRKKAAVYTPSRDSARGWPNQCRSCGSTMANTSISSTPAIRKAGQAIHIKRWFHIGNVSLVVV